MLSLPYVTLFIVITGLLSCVLFIIGYRKGFIDLIKDINKALIVKEDNSKNNYVWIILASVCSTGIFIALLGFHSFFIDIAPLFSIITTSVIGLLFFIEPKLD